LKLIEEILIEYLTKDDLQRIARDHDLPVSRTKEEIAGELLALDDLDPSEAVAFLGVWQLRNILQERGQPSGAYREALVDRVLALIEDESQPRARRTRALKRPVPESKSPPPPVQSAPIDVVVPPSPPPPIRVHIPPTPSVPIEVRVQPTPPPSVIVRVFPPLLAAWGFVGVVTAVVFGGIYFVTTAELGTVWGVGVGLIAGTASAVGLLLTENRWAPGLSRASAEKRHSRQP
jgi:hypothetical protein